MVKFPPKPPPIHHNPLTTAGKLIKQASAGIDTFAQEVDETLTDLGQDIDSTLAPSEEKTGSALAGVTNQATLAWQLDHLIDDLLHLEVDHLPLQGIIDGKPCDCIAKAAREARRHAIETVPIAARQGVDAKIFTEIARWANHLIDIGTLDAVRSGKYDQEYLEQSGTASNFRKQLEAMLSQLRKSHRQECETCPSILNLKTFLDERRAQRAGPTDSEAGPPA
ncbi:MAG: hypothetical protein WC551_08190 [Patescibacteria group bacterium]